MERTKILHFADIQVEARNQQQRANEYRDAFNHLFDVIAKDTEIKMVVFPGDAFEFCIPNDVERQLWIDFLIKIPSYIEFIFTDGNHDLIQKNNQYIVDGYHEDVQPSPISTMVRGINRDNIRYFDNTDFYQSNNNPEIWFAVWSHTRKYDRRYNGVYSPYEQNINKHHELVKNDAFIIDLYHDPISCAVNWDAKPVTGCEKHKGLDAFGRLVLAGDIHNPAIYKHKDTVFTYPSSLIIRDFGEGDYYDGLKLYQRGNDKHGYNIVVIDENRHTTIDFVPFTPPVTYTTIRFGADFKYNDESIKLLDVKNIGSWNTKVRFMVEANHMTFAEWEPRIREELKNKLVAVSIGDTVWGKTIIDSDQIEVNPIKLERGNLVTNDEILEIANGYIEKRVKAAKSIQKEDKEKIIGDLQKLFLTELAGIDRENKVKNFYLVSGKANNFMTFGDDVTVEFEKPDAKTIVRIKGANKVGKTTLLHFINWMITDQCTPEQTPKLLRDSRLSVFNDYRFDTDESGGELIFNLNDVNYRLVKTCTRIWDKGATKEPGIWKEQIKMIPSITLKLESFDGSVNIDNTAEVEIWLDQNIGNFYDLSRLMFVNFENLNSLIKGPSAQLNDQILYNLGLNFFDKLADRYEEIRSDRMSKVFKPTESIDELLSLVKAENEKQVAITLDSDNASADKALQEAELLLVTASYDTIKEKIVNVGFTKEQAKNGIQQLNVAIDNETNNITNIETTIQQNELKIVLLDGLDASLQKARLTVELLQTEAIKYEQRIKELESDNELTKGKIRERGLVIQNEQNVLIAEKKELITGIKQKISKQELELSNLTADQAIRTAEVVEKYNIKKTAAKDAAMTELLKIKQQINDLNISISHHSIALEGHKQKITELEGTEKCPTCQRLKDDEMVKNILETIEVSKVLVDTLTKNICYETETKNELEAKLITDAGSLKSEIDVFTTEQEKEINTITVDISNKKNAIKSVIENLTTELTAIELKIKELTDGITALIKADPEVIQMLSVIETTKSEIGINQNGFVDKQSEVGVAKAEVTRIETELLQLPILKEENLRHQVAITEKQGKINQYKEKITDLDSKILVLEENEKFQLELANIQLEMDKFKSDISRIDALILNAQNDLTRSKERVVTYNEKIEMHVSYRRTDSAMRIYKQLLGKDGLVFAVFSSITTVLNTKLNDLLENVNFRLFFNESGILQMVDLSKSIKAVRNVSFSSGMESTFLGLSLWYVMKVLNATKQFSPFFADEISGKLNNGNDLSYEATDYQHEFTVLLDKIKETVPVYIVDHVIKNLNESSTLEVIPTNKGSYIYRSYN